MDTTAVEKVGTDLQDTLVELTDLGLQAKQLHWNVTGRHFVTLHTQLDGLTDEVRAAADAVAERAVAIGYSPDARVGTVAKESPLPDAPHGRVPDAAAVGHVVDALDVVDERIRRRLEPVGAYDLVSQDLLIGVLAGLEKQRWMFDAQRV